ncbi:MAG: sodium/solute symporter [Polyangiales bacterium]
MTAIDWTILAVYLGAVIGLSAWLGRTHTSNTDYYVGGRKLPWWALALSILATQTSANSFIGIPAFVALRPGGGLTWLEYELAVPLAMIAVMALLVPVFRRLELVSLYEYLELRFDRRTRLVMSGVFLLSRGAATGIGVYAVSLVLEVCLGLPLWACILLMGGVTVVYDTLGGMSAVVWTDVIQLVVLVIGIVLCIVIALGEVGGIGGAFTAHDAARMVAIDPRTGIGDGSTTPFWGFLIGGFVLYVSYYGVDQSQAQRALAAPTVDAAKRSLLVSGLARFPLTLLYVVMGLAIGAVYLQSEDLRAAVPHDKLDSLVPAFILTKLPAGARGVLFAAVIAAAMSSLDSALNSLSAATMRDFVEPYVPKERHLRVSRWTTASWGAFITGSAFVVGDLSTTVVEGINTLGSVFYGPLLAAFASGILDRRSTGPGVLAGVAAGIAVNLGLAIGAKDALFWMWWNVTGLVVGAVVTTLVSRAFPAQTAAGGERAAVGRTWEEIRAAERPWLTVYAVLVAYFLTMFLFAYFLGDLLRSFG